MLFYLLIIPIIASLVLMGISCKSKLACTALNSIIALAAISEIALVLYLYFNFDNTAQTLQYITHAPIKLGFLNSNIILGVDGTSLAFIILTVFLTPCACLWVKGSESSRLKIAMLLILESFAIGVFVATDLMVLYIFFELTLVPMFFIIGIWGGDKRKYAAFKLFMYTAAGSILMLVATLYIAIKLGTTDIIAVRSQINVIPEFIRQLLWWAFFISFSIKIPMFPLHSWLPDAHVQAPTYGSVMLAGILIKMGAYGFMRVLLPIFPDICSSYTTLVNILSVVAIIYTSLVALSQDEMKKVIAYSSIAHMGIVTIGLFSLTPEGINGAMVQMISHGIVSAALFFCVGLIYERGGSKLIKHFSGLSKIMPMHTVVFFVFVLAAIGLPGTSGFVGEYLVIQGLMHKSFAYSALSATGIILSACYMLSLYRRVSRGPFLENSFTSSLQDFNVREMCIMLPLAASMLIIGFYPESIFHMVKNDYLFHYIGVAK